MIENNQIINLFSDSEFFNYCQTVKKTKTRKILLIQIFQIDIENFNYKIARDAGYYIFPPTGLQYLYESIKNRDLEIEIFDINFELLKRINNDLQFNVEHWDELVSEKLEHFKPDIIGVSCLFDFSLQYFFHLLKRIKAESEAIVVCGGVVATYEWENILKKQLAHFCVDGEGEEKFNYLLDQLTEENRHTAVVKGIHYYQNDQCQESKGVADRVRFETNMIDSYQLIPIEEYNKYGSLNPYSRQREVNYGFATIQFSRGCRAQCTFCSVRSLMGKGVRTRGVEKVVEEMEYLITQRNVRHFEWLDDDLLFDSVEFKKILQTIINNQWSITWSANNGVIASSIKEDIVDLMELSGCIGFKIGIESGNPDMLRKVLKPSRHRHFLRAAKYLQKKKKIFVGGNYILGLPDEYFFMMMDSFRFALNLNLDWSAFTVCQEIRGASAFSEMGELFEAQIKSEGTSGIGNFIPTRRNKKGQLLHKNSDNLQIGLNVFNIEPMVLPDKEQVHEIWFTFNLIVNYINNKNLTKNGNIDKFIRWIKTALKAYPTNPYMNLFLAYAYCIDEDKTKAMNCFNIAVKNIDAYWYERFNAFYFTELIETLPDTKNVAFLKIEKIKKTIAPYYAMWVKLDYGEYPKSISSEL